MLLLDQKMLAGSPIFLENVNFDELNVISVKKNASDG